MNPDPELPDDYRVPVDDIALLVQCRVARLRSALEEAGREETPRISTRTPAREKRKRLEEKRRRSKLKRARQKPEPEEP